MAGLTVGDLIAYLSLDTAQFDTAIRRVSGQASTTGTDISRGLGTGARGAEDVATGADRASAATGRLGSSSDLASKALGAMGKIFAGAKIVSYLTESITASSDLNETVSKSQQIFGESAATIAAWGDTASTSVGLSKAAALDAAANFGNMFTQVGFAGKAAADMSTSTVQLAADLGSFNNLPTADVAEKIQGAFNGEYDSLQQLIPNISAARVETEAMSASGKTSADQLTQQDKITAVLKITTEDGSKALGDFARTSDGFANQSKITAATIEDQKAALGDKLMPVVQTLMGIFQSVGIPVLGMFGDILGAVAGFALPLVKILGDVLTWVAGLPGPVLAAVVAFTAVTLLAGPIATLGTAVMGLGATATAAGTAIKAAFLSNPIGLAIVGIVTAISLFSMASDTAKAKTDAWHARVDGLKGSLDQATGAVTDATRVTAQGIIGDATLTKWRTWGIDIGLATDAMTRMPGASQASAAQLQGLTADVIANSAEYQNNKSALDAAGVSTSALASAMLNGNYDAINAQIAGLGLTLYDTGDGFVTLQSSVDGSSTVIANANGKVNDLKGAYESVNGVAGDTSTAQQGIAEHNANVASTAGDAAGATKDLADKTKDAVPVADDLSKAVSAEELANKNLETAVRNAIAALDEMQHRNDPKTANDAAGATRDYAAAVRDQDKAQRDVGAAQDALVTAGLKLEEVRGKAVSSTYSQTQKDLDLSAAARDVADATDGVQDAYDKVSDSGVDLYASGEKIRSTYTEQAKEARDAALATGGTLADAHAAAAKKVADLTTGLYNQLIQSGHTDAEAQAYIKTLGLVPDEVATSIEATDNATVKVTDVSALTILPKDAVINATDNATVVISGVAGQFIPGKTADINAKDQATVVINGVQGLFIADKSTDVNVTDNATSVINGIKNNTIPDKTVKVTFNGVLSGAAVTPGITTFAGLVDAVKNRAGGGPLVAPGPPGVDSALFYGADNEHVVTSPEVDAVGGHGAMYAIRKAMLAGTLTGYAGGGPVMPTRGMASGGQVGGSGMAITVQPPIVDVRVFMDSTEIVSRVEVIVHESNAAQARQLLGAS